MAILKRPTPAQAGRAIVPPMLKELQRYAIDTRQLASSSRCWVRSIVAALGLEAHSEGKDLGTKVSIFLPEAAVVAASSEGADE